LTRLGEPTVDLLESLAAILDQARAAIARVDISLKLGAARSDRSKAETALGDWKSRWAAAVEPLGLGVDASPARANAVLGEVDDLIKAGEEMAALRKSIDESIRLERRFEVTVEVLRDRLKFEVVGHDVETVSGEIKARLDAARESKTRREGLLKRDADERAKLAKAGGKIDRAKLALDALVREARCDSPEGLLDAERASDEVKRLQAKLQGLDEQLEDLADADSVEHLRQEAGRSDAASLDERIATLADRLPPLEAERNELLEEIGRCSERLKQMDGGPAAADAQQAVEERVARLAFDVERYVRLRLASAVLREAVERYRKEHQGPVLDRAGALFASLTAGSFSGLRAEVDDKGQPILLGVRADGTTLLPPEGMSEGTADQLYLALRLASLQTYLDDHEPMPLIVDDILVNFDNARALAALKALADLSKRTQVLFFTHHNHLVDLARSALGDDVLFVHHLAYPPIGANGHHEEGSNVEAVKPKRKRKATPLAGEG
jgi:uncharacterized protein YhaN